MPKLFTDASVKHTAATLARMGASVVQELRVALNDVAHEIIVHAKENHGPPKVDGKQIPSMGGLNRPDRNNDWWDDLGSRSGASIGGTPRYADDTARLTRSIHQPEPPKIDGSGRLVTKVSAGMGAGVGYAPYVEFGTSESEPHPFMRPALAAGVRYANREHIFEKAIQKGLKKEEAG